MEKIVLLINLFSPLLENLNFLLLENLFSLLMEKCTCPLTLKNLVYPCHSPLAHLHSD